MIDELQKKYIRKLLRRLMVKYLKFVLLNNSDDYLKLEKEFINSIGKALAKNET